MTTSFDAEGKRIHGGPYDRGSMDRYYGRGPSPHKWPDGTGNGEKVILTDEAEIAEYLRGYEEEDDRKDWGDPDW